MKNARKAKVLILTAGFGEGHNSAANHIAVALDRAGAKVHVSDPCAESAPWLNQRLRDFYRVVTTYFPRIWYRIYRSTDRQDFSKKTLPFMRKPERYLEQLIADFQPTAIVSTYPLYPYFCERIFSRLQRKPVFTVITDSIEINSIWRRAPSDYFLITDEATRRELREHEMPMKKVHVAGFAVHPRFGQLAPLTPSDAIAPFRVLYFPTAKKPHVRRVMKAFLEADPRIEITVVLGKNVRKLYQRAAELKRVFPNRVKLKGWTRKVPELLTSHHLVVGKAGGATVHEAVAACSPMFVHHLVPGQEEGNLALLQEVGAGELTETAEDIQLAVNQLLRDDGRRWREMKKSLFAHARPEASVVISDFIIEHS